MGIFDKGVKKTNENFFQKLSRVIVGKNTIDDEVLDNLEEILIESDVGVDTTLKIIERITARVAKDKYLGINELNNILKDTAFKDAQDSTSVLTARLFFTNDPQKKEFSFDIAILAKNKIGNYCRLIHDKSFIERFYWNEVPNSENVYDKAEELKENGWWEDVREKYLELKNIYLSRPDFHQHPSYVCFVEAVNLTYQQYENY